MVVASYVLYLDDCLMSLLRFAANKKTRNGKLCKLAAALSSSLGVTRLVTKDVVVLPVLVVAFQVSI